MRDYHHTRAPAIRCSGDATATSRIRPIRHGPDGGIPRRRCHPFRSSEGPARQCTVDSYQGTR